MALSLLAGCQQLELRLHCPRGGLHRALGRLLLPQRSSMGGLTGMVRAALLRLRLLLQVVSDNARLAVHPLHHFQLLHLRSRSLRGVNKV